MYTDPTGHTPEEINKIIGNIDSFKSAWNKTGQNKKLTNEQISKKRSWISNVAQSEREKLKGQEEYKKNPEYRKLIDQLISGGGKNENWNQFKNVSSYVTQKGYANRVNWDNFSEGVLEGGKIGFEGIGKDLTGKDVAAEWEQEGKQSQNDLSKYDNGYTFTEVVGGTTAAGAVVAENVAKYWALGKASFGLAGKITGVKPSFFPRATGVGEGTANTASKLIDVSKLNSKSLYRAMSESELNAVKETGKLRGGWEGETYFTDSYYKDASNAQNRLSLKDKPQYVVEFKITNNPKVTGGTRVKPAYGGTGGGREYVTTDPVEVDITNYQKLK
jgi:hypothetical protein